MLSEPHVRNSNFKLEVRFVVDKELIVPTKTFYQRINGQKQNTDQMKVMY